MSKRVLLAAIITLSSSFGWAQLSGLPAPSVSNTNDGVHAGADLLYCNTTQPSILSTITNAQGWGGSTGSGTCTKYLLNLPSAAPPDSLQLMEFPSPTSSASQATWVDPTALTTAAQCLAAVTVTTPCIAYQANATGLSATFSGTLHALYTTAAPANGVFEFCPTEFQNTGTGTIAGQAVMQVNWTTAGGNAVSGANLQNITFQTGGGVGNGSCTTVSTAVNTTLSVNMTTASGTGTVTWEYDLVVRRLK
jgi:hypothetical protein